MDGESKKKRRRTVERMKTTEFCHPFGATGQCPFGDKCKYSHDFDEFLGEQAPFFNRLKAWRDETSSSGRLVQPALFNYPHPPFHRTYESPPNDETSMIIHAHHNGVLALCLSKGNPASGDLDSFIKVEFIRKPSYAVGASFAEFIRADESRVAIRTPLPGTILEVNPKLETSLQLVREDPLEKGYLVLFKARSPFHLFLDRYFLILALTNEYEEDATLDS